MVGIPRTKFAGTALPALQSAPDPEAVPPPEVTVGVIAGAVVTFVVAYLLVRLLTRGLEAVSDRVVEYRITVRMFVPVVKFLVYGAAVYLVLVPLLDLTSAQLLAVSGLLGAAIGFGLQDLFANLVGGFALLVEKPYRVGDKVTLAGEYGEVTDISLRATTLVTNDDSTVVVPNYQFVTDAVVNANTGNPEMMVVVEFHVAREADTAAAMAIVEDAIVTSKYVYVSPDHPYAVRVEDDPFYRTVRGKAYVNDLRNEFAFKSDVSERVIAAFDEAGIEGPSPVLPRDDATHGD